MDYNHIIITRFNLDFEDDPQARCLQPEWLEKRFDLFETYCLPSVLQQTCQNFTWVILSSDATPAQYKKRLLSYQRRESLQALWVCLAILNFLL